MMLRSSTDIDILGPEAIADPAGYFAPLREHQPIVFDERHKSWLVTRHDHISACLRDKRFSSDRIVPFIERKLSGPDADPDVRAAFEVLADWLVFNDPPAHRRLRGLIHKVFTPRAVQQIGEHVEQLTDELLATLPRDGEIDIKHRFTYPLPAIVIAEMLGVPPDDRDQFSAWSQDVAAIVSAQLDDPRRYERGATGMGELASYCLGLVRRYEAQPADNILTALIQAREDKDALSEAEIVATCTLLLFAGHETTANLIASSLMWLARHPDQLAALRDGRVDPASAIEELLRWDGPGKAVTRVLAEDVELDGQHLRAGQRVFFVLAAANRDPRVFDEPEQLLLDRDPNPHVAFGHGFHYCLGASLARLEATIAIPAALQRLDGMQLSDRPLRWEPSFLTRGLEELHIRLGEAA